MAEKRRIVGIVGPYTGRSFDVSEEEAEQAIKAGWAYDAFKPREPREWTPEEVERAKEAAEKFARRDEKSAPPQAAAEPETAAERKASAEPDTRAMEAEASGTGYQTRSSVSQPKPTTPTKKKK